ncbi:TetR/AcrR family transcriptional regulator [Micromonospora sp. NPDC049230]|uniref:TetR/AcrR family transcriptional regulator n=1 Tax=Micromonospora sp. NPDC049230 TaxID=3155502 RepID=UPI0033ECFF70
MNPLGKQWIPSTSTIDRRLLAATERLLIDGATFTEIGMQQICTEAGVARSTFYSHFRDKTTLLLRLATELLGSSFDITSAWQPAGGVDRLAEVFTEVVTIYRQHATVRRALAEVAAYDPAVRQFCTERIDQFIDGTAMMLRTEQEAGRIPAGLDPVCAARLIVLGGEQAIVDHVTTTTDPRSDSTFAGELARTWWYGVYHRPAR